MGKTLIPLSSIVALMLVAACDQGANQQAGTDTGTTMDQTTTDQSEMQAETLENQADQVREQSEQQADTLEEQADVERARPDAATTTTPDSTTTTTTTTTPETQPR